MVACGKPQNEDEENHPKLVSRELAVKVSVPGGYSQTDQLNNNQGRDTWEDQELGSHTIFRLPKPLSKVFFQWQAGHNYGYCTYNYGAPTDYIIEVSGDSTDGMDGTWTTMVTVANNRVMTRSHILSSPNMQWIRFQANTAEEGYRMDEFDLYDINECKTTHCDTWGFIGDSITAQTFRRSSSPLHFNDWVHASNGERFPSMMNLGIGGNNSSQLLARLDEALANSPGVDHWAIGIGSNDGLEPNEKGGGFERNLRSIINTLLAAKKKPIVARIPYRTDGNASQTAVLNEVIDRVTAEMGLTPGPDLWTHFQNNPDQLYCEGEDCGLHPTEEGEAAIEKLWAEVAIGLSLAAN